MLEAILHLIGPFWEPIAIAGTAVIGLVLAYFNGLSTGKAKQKLKQMEADRKGAENVRKTADQINRDLEGVDTDSLLNSTNGFRDD